MKCKLYIFIQNIYVGQMFNLYLNEVNTKNIESFLEN